MKIHELVLSSEVAAHLQALLATGRDAVLLGREFGGARIVTAGLPAPTDEAGWTRLDGLQYGLIGMLGNPPSGESLRRLLPGDIVLEAEPDMDPSSWRARVMDWTGPADETVLRDVPVTVA